ncbi:MAG: IPExxxVDY family protein [Bacteroidetes bacterium]|nr:IPExxxVDY family protein [Bacteroidota bacterium]
MLVVRNLGPVGEKIRKNTLHVGLETDFLLGGIATPLRDYRMAWSLNRYLGIDLERIEDVELSPGHLPENGGFSRFRAIEEMDKATIYLISNRFSGKLLLPGQRNADYLLLVYGSWYADKFPDLLASIRPLPNIQTVFPIEPQTVSRRLNLLFE